MGWVLRTSESRNNPTLSGGIYGEYITIGKGVYFKYDGTRTRGIILIGDGGKYGLDSVQSFEYKGVALTETTDWIFHRGIITPQIEPKTATADISNTFTSVSHGFVNTDQVRLRSINGNLPTPLSEDALTPGQSSKYFIVNKTDDTFELSLTSGGATIDITNVGTGGLIVWKANKGFDDAEQGLPVFCPETLTTFNNITYVEFKLPIGQSHATNPPDWADFRTYGTGRRLMDYDDEGAELGVISGSELLANTPLEVVDNLFWNYKIKEPRIGWASWRLMRDAADVEILQRVRTDETAVVNGLTGRYFSGLDYNTLIISRLDPDINFNFGTTAPAPGVPITNYSIIWKGQIKPRYTELYDLIAHYDDYCYLAINGQVLIDNLAVTTTTVQYTFQADQLYDIEVRFKQYTSVAYIDLKWQSASQALEVIPNSRLYPSDEIVKRYRCHTAFNQATEAAEVHERLMERIPGWDWTDNNGLIEFLPPDRPVMFAFSFDRIDDDSKANFANKSFEKKKRELKDRKDFVLFLFRNVLLTAYPQEFVQADRPDLRRFTNGEPSNDEASDLGVCSRSLAERMAEMEMVEKTDPPHVAQILGGRASSKVRKCQIITATYYDGEGNYVVNERYMVTFHAWGASTGANQFSLLPIPENFYTDEPVIE